MSRLIEPDGTDAGHETTVTPANGTTYTLQELQRYVGGYIEVLRLPGGGWMVLNEDGKRLELPYNRAATRIARTLGIAREDYIVGSVLLTDPGEISEGGDDDDEEA